MRQFFKFFTASCLGTIAGLLLISGISMLIFFRVSASTSKPKPIEANSILWIKLDQAVPERTNNLEMNPFDLKNQTVLGLHDMIKAIEAAAEDSKIKGIFLDLENISLGGEASLTALHQALIGFKESGKFIYAYGNYFTQATYHLASTADQIYLNPLGMIDFRGFGAIIPFFKNMLDKIGVDMQVFYAGDFKSATEPYRLQKMSDNNRKQVREYVDSLYKHFIHDIALARNISEDSIRAYANDYRLRNPEQALLTKMIDHVGYRDEVLNAIRLAAGLEKDAAIRATTPTAYFEAANIGPDYTIRDKIAVVYAEGSIVMGQGDQGNIGDEKYTRMLRDIRKDDRVKALVVRINSPGGSALASENIWREMQLFKEAGIPVVTSMGDYAASGGYYMAVAGDRVLADPNTLTGSIGVFLMIPNAYKLLDDKLGISFDTINTGQYATSFNPYFPLEDQESRIMQQMTNEIYELFLKRVAEGRNMTRDQVHEVAQGRVWTGTKAVELGLVDTIGNLEDAIALAAELAGLEKYRTTEYPRIKDPLTLFMEELMGMPEEIRSSAVKAELGEYYEYYQHLKEIQEESGVQARLPFLLELN